jgi:hypothetical protein
MASFTICRFYGRGFLRHRLKYLDIYLNILAEPSGRSRVGAREEGRGKREEGRGKSVAELRSSKNMAAGGLKPQASSLKPQASSL